MKSFPVRAIVLALVAGAAMAQNLPEVTIDGNDFKRLDAFEAQRMQEADKCFAARNYRQAVAAYESFIQEFDRSEALPYAMLKKGRSLQLDGKRFEAIRVYEGEVLDYFPDTVQYAAPALYYIGECHWQNGDVKEAMKAWAEMADDVDYSRHYLAAPALNALARNLSEQGKPGEAVKYWWKVAENFRYSSRDPAREAMNQVIAHYIRTEPNEAKLAEFYKVAGTFEWDPRDAESADPSLYWTRVMENIAKYGEFNEAQRELKERFYAYWARVFTGKNPEWDDFQYSRICYQRQADGDNAKWEKALDDQFAKYQKEDSYDRIVSFLGYFARDRKRAKFDEYYKKLNFEKMSPAAIERLVRVIYDNGLGEDLGRNTFAHLPLEKMDDNAKYHFGRWMWHKDEPPLVDLYNSFENRSWGQLELLRYYDWRKNLEKGPKLAEEVAAAYPDAAKEALYMKGSIQQHHGQREEAIQTYRRSEHVPHSIYRMAECYQGIGKPDSAIAQYRELENFFPDQAPEAALRIAWVHRDVGDQKQFIAALRAVMKKYPASGQSSTAHQELEKLGVAIGGGIGAE
ncbi:MAG: tetratricopeptide repeat protein [Kiritimatiellia bacterium]